jgi:hypothetical protein
LNDSMMSARRSVWQQARSGSMRDHRTRSSLHNERGN